MSIRGKENSEIIIESAHNVETSLLNDFYHEAYEGRPYRLDGFWSWLYRSSYYENKIPLVMHNNKKVIAHAGMIPFKVNLKGTNYNASWFVDFALLDEFQRQGLGQILTKRWMEFSDFYVTFCNEKSLGVFKKLGWEESSDSFLHYYLVNPFNHPELINKIPLFFRKFLNFLTSIFLRLIYKRFASSPDKLKFEGITEENLKHFSQQNLMNEFDVIRDDEYFSWRILESPFKEKYRVCTLDNKLYFLIKFQDMRKNSAHIDIMLISDNSKSSQIKALISTLALWCFKNSQSHIRLFTSDKEKSHELKKSLFPIVMSPAFAYFSQNTELLEKLKEVHWSWQLIDSDFEFNS